MTVDAAAEFLDVPPFPASGFATLADRIAALLGTGGDVLLVQGEAIVALEAVAASLAAPTVHALNIATSPYGALFGGWLRRGGASVTDLRPAVAGRPIAIEAVASAFAADTGINAVALAHAESATGMLNPLAEIAALARARGALVIVDAVASVGGHALDMDALGVDVAVIGPQKALGGSSGLSAVALARRVWPFLDRPGATADSILSLMDHKRLWLDRGRGALPGMPSALEFRALDAALARIEAEGIDAAVARHDRAARAVRASLPKLGVDPWVENLAEASALVTAAVLPDRIDRAAFLDALPLGATGIDAAIGEPGGRVVRINHTGSRADREPVLASVTAFGLTLRRCGAGPDVDGAVAAAAETFDWFD
ncbi:aminotransferase class V-fold PLP-dependent enzyme [Aureimonas leprariae]|uniref:Alanine--glyoxylate aminotransferase family protein n=1 Tax=Plantimonas leprariae TaxID=2615207 RepID=A0A7V7TVU9_9HYPH|nr:aminotransferase class V-fold PLP-dependent enzyme [Aureimonas leprariae]KAB0679116.1 alanine--glyoxylate aminotransferase family protein [Aureimonas leprariae]